MKGINFSSYWVRGLVFSGLMMSLVLCVEPVSASIGGVKVSGSEKNSSEKILSAIKNWNRSNPNGIFLPGLVSLPVRVAYEVVSGGRFGARRSYGAHQGTDFAVPFGTPVFSMFTGTVKGIISGGFCGNGIEITNGSYRQFFCHVAKTGLSVGQKVEAGQMIGKVDMSGRTSGPHAHVELWVDGKPVDIEAFFKDPQKLSNLIAKTSEKNSKISDENQRKLDNLTIAYTETEAWQLLSEEVGKRSKVYNYLYEDLKNNENPENTSFLTNGTEIQRLQYSLLLQKKQQLGQQQQLEEEEKQRQEYARHLSYFSKVRNLNHPGYGGGRI